MDIRNRDLLKFRRQDRANFGLPTDEDDVTMDDAASEATSATLRPSSLSRWSTPSIQGVSEFSGQATLSDFQSEDFVTDPLYTSQEHSSRQISFIIATDFGTTFSSVAFAKFENGRWGEAKSISNYPDDSMPSGRSSLEVPTETWYPDVAIRRDSNGKSNPLETENDPMDDIYTAGDDDDLEAAPIPSSLRGNNNSDEEMEDDDTVTISAEDGVNGLLWGYGIQRQRELSYIDHSEFKRIERSKLMLDATEATKAVRDKLQPILKDLKKGKIIQKDEDVIADYLVRLFQHTKEQLVAYHGLSEDDLIEHVLCVPNVWSASSSRKMQNAMKEAIEKSQFGNIENLFIVAEPEAAAEYVLNRTRDVNPEEIFLIIDAGGGTVDLTTYAVRTTYPLRLEREVSKPTGGLYGSSYLNQAFQAHLKKRLKDEKYLEIKGFTIDGIVDAATVEFENRIKRSKNVTVAFPASGIRIQGLEGSDEKNFKDHVVIMERQDYLEIFSPLLCGISKLMKGQLTSAIEANRPVKKVLLIGGFAGSPSLRNFLDHELKVFSKGHGITTRLINSDAPETAVALGAVLRAKDKANGPSRKIRSSYGFLRHEPVEKDIPAHTEGGIKANIDKLDGRRYIRNTIFWLVRVDDEVLDYAEYTIEVEHTFSALQKGPFLCAEELWVSDKSKESHYRTKHEKNKDAEMAGFIVADMTFLKTEGIIQPVDPEPGMKGKRHYRVEFNLVMIIDGRNLRFEARWPLGGNGQVQQRGQISIAAAFQPGTE